MPLFTRDIAANGITTTTASIPFAVGLSSAAQITSSVATGTAPFSVASTTNVANLNASTLSGNAVGTSGAAIGLLNGKNTISNNWTFSSNPTISNGTNIDLGTTTGTKFGTGITQKIGFYNATPIVQRSGASQANVATTAAVNLTPYGYTTAAQADAIVTLVNELRDWAVAQGFIKGSA